jgi:hypothetical protein
MENKVKAVLYSEPNTTSFKKIGFKKPILKSEFEEKNFYPDVPADHVKVLKADKNGKPTKKTPESVKAKEPLEDVNTDEFTGFEQRSHYVEIEGTSVSHIFFEDGSLYKIGAGFIRSASEENAEKVSELLKSAE